jgi:hypothetical protein
MKEAAPRKEIKKEEIPGDCNSCRIVGTVTLASLSMYANYLRVIAPKSSMTNRVFLGSLSAGKATVTPHSTLFAPRERSALSTHWSHYVTSSHV